MDNFYIFIYFVGFILAIILFVTILKNNGSIRSHLISDWLKEQEYLKRQKKERRLAEKLFGKFRDSIMPVKTGIFRNLSTQTIAIITTSGLQVVSFFTTYAGIRFFFSDINLFISFIIAFVIQFLLLFTVNIAFNKKRKNAGKKILAILLLFVSVTFSYIGVVNTIINPLQTLNSTYVGYKSDFNGSVYKLGASEFGNKNLIEINNNITKIFSLSDSIESLKIILKKIENQEIPDNITINGNSVTYSVNSDILKDSLVAALQYSLIEKLKGQNWKDDDTMKFNEKINEVMNQNTEEEMYRKSKELFLDDTEGKELLAKYNLNIVNYNEFIKKSEDAFTAVNMTFTKQKELNQLSLADIQNICICDKEYALNETIFKIDDGETKGNNVMEKMIFSVLDSLNPTKLSNVETKINQVNSDMNNKYSKFLSKDGKITSLNNDLLTTASDEFDNVKKLKVPRLESSYILVFNYFRQSEYRTAAIAALILAILVDVLSFIIPLLLVSNRYSALYIKKREDVIDEEEDILESLFHAIYTIEQINAIKSKEKWTFYGLVDHLKNDFIKKLSSFIEVFDLLPVNIDGTTFLYAESNGQLNKNIVITLSILRYLSVIKGTEINFILGKSAVTDSDKLKLENVKDEKNYYLLDSKFFLWYLDVFSEASMSFYSSLEEK